MKNLLFAALALGCFVVATHANWREEFQFTDSNGNCWHCAPGKACERCPNSIWPGVDLPDHPDSCPLPDCESLRNSGFLSVLLPHNVTNLFYQCIANPSNPAQWIPVERECPCDTIFSFATQRCDWPWEWEPFCRGLDLKVVPCPGPDDNEPTDVPTDEPTDEPTDAPTESPTTAPPCVCIPWWPCLCNPCAHFPCGSCGGCPGMPGMWG